MPDRYFTKYLPEPRRPRKGTSWIGWLLVVVIILILTGIVTVWVSLDTFLKSDVLRAIASEQVSQKTKVVGQFEPFQWTGNSVFSEGFAGTGAGRTLTASQIRGSVDWFSFFSEEWRVEELEMASLQWKTGIGAAATPPAVLPPAVPEDVPFFASLAPAGLRMEQIRVGEFSMEHSSGDQSVTIRNTALRAKPGASGFDLSSAGGDLLYGGGKPWRISHAGGRASGDGPLFLTESELQHPAGGTAGLTGEIGWNASTPTRLHVQLRGLDVAEFLTGRYAGNLTGRLQGGIHYNSNSEMPIHGSLVLTEGRLTGLPVLQRIADFTRVPEFIAPGIHNAQGDFEKSGTRLVVKNLIMESGGLMKIEGNFVIEGGEIHGTFELGVAARTLQWIPGAENRVFRVRADPDGYLWTPLRLTGPVENPREDLSARLAAGAGEEVVDFTIDNAAAAAGAASSLLQNGAGLGAGLLDSMLGIPSAVDSDASGEGPQEPAPAAGSGIFSPLFR